jgi:hypothetical protein
MHESLRSENLRNQAEDDDSPDDLSSIVEHVFNMIPFKLVAFVFIFYIMLNTNSFVDDFLTKFSGAVDGRYPTERGIMIQATLLCLFMIIIHILIESEYL